MPDPVDPTAAELGKRCKQPAGNPEVVAALPVAVALVDDALREAVRPVPDAVRKELILRAGHSLYDGTKSSHGIGQLTTGEDGGTVRRPRDPLASGRTIIAGYLAQGIA